MKLFEMVFWPYFEPINPSIILNWSVRKARLWMSNLKFQSKTESINSTLIGYTHSDNLLCSFMIYRLEFVQNLIFWSGIHLKFNFYHCMDKEWINYQQSHFKDNPQNSHFKVIFSVKNWLNLSENDLKENNF